jgi:cyclase
MQSRNFRLQRIGDFQWLENFYKLQETSFAIDELVIVDASRNKKNITQYSQIVTSIAERVFIPVAVGGGINSIKDADTLFHSGADKLVINSALWNNSKIVTDIIEVYGSQSVIASVDYMIKDNESVVFINNGTTELPLRLMDYLKHVEELGVGEILLNSIDLDGTGFGYDIETLNAASSALNAPLISIGGAGNVNHFKEALSIDKVRSVATANLLNFIGDGLKSARDGLINDSYNLPRW